MANIYVLRTADTEEKLYNATVRHYLWNDGFAIGMLCRHVRFFKTRKAAQEWADKANRIWKGKYQLTVQPAFAD